MSNFNNNKTTISTNKLTILLIFYNMIVFNNYSELFRWFFLSFFSSSNSCEHCSSTERLLYICHHSESDPQVSEHRSSFISERKLIRQNRIHPSEIKRNLRIAFTACSISVSRINVQQFRVLLQTTPTITKGTWIFRAGITIHEIILIPIISWDDLFEYLCCIVLNRRVITAVLFKKIQGAGLWKGQFITFGD